MLRLVEFRVLGLVEARRDGEAVSLGGPKLCALLAILLLHANEVVSRDRLIEGLWGEHAPASASHTLDDYVSRLRKALGDGRLVRRAPGYVLRVESGELDLDRFSELVEAGEQAFAEGRAGEAATSLEKALALWRGDPLANASGDGSLLAETGRLEELRLAALEQRIESDLALGRHARLVGELEGLVRTHPLHEGFRGQLMLALYRSGRQADALAVYAETRALLVERLGLEPGLPLRELQQQILVQDPVLQLGAATDASRDRPPAVRARARSRMVFFLGAGALIATASAVLAALVLNWGSAHARPAAAPSVAFVDSNSGKLHADLPVPTTDAGELRAGGGWIWDLRGPGVLFQIDRHTLRLVHSYPIGTIGRFAVGRGMLWFVAPNGQTLLRFDPHFGLVTRRTPLSPESDPNIGAIADSAGFVAFADGSVWVAHGLAQVDRVDPASGRIVHRFPIRDAWEIATGGGAVWVSSADLGLLTKIDPATNTIVATAHIQPWVCCVAVGGGAVWASNNERVWKLSPDGELLDTIKIPSGTGELAFGDGALWNSGLGTLTRIDAQTDATRDFRLGHILSGVTTSRGLIAVDVSPTDFDQVAALKGRVLRVRMSQDWIDDPDPAVGGEPGANEWPWLQQLLYATTGRLLTYQHSAAPAGWQLVPEIAASLPTVSRDERTYTFRIRSGVRFSPPSNQPVTAETFKYSIERALSPVLGKNAPAFSVATDIVGVAAYRTRRAAHIAGIRAQGNTLTITLRRPAPDLPERMALSYFAPVPIGTPAVANGLRDPIPSTGPYYLALNDEGTLAILRRNPNYRGPRPQRLDAIVLTSHADAAADINAINTGKADYIAEPSLPLSRPKPTRSQGASAHGRRRYIQSPLLGVDELAFNTRHGRFANAHLRRAANFALDRPAIAAALGDQVTDQYLPAGIPGYNSHHVYPLTGPEIKRARSLTGPFRGSVTLAVCSDPACLEVGRIVAADLGRIGIHTHVRQYAGALAPTTERTGADIVLARIFAPYPDPVAALRAALGDRDTSELDRLARLNDRTRITATAQLELNLLRTSAPAAALGTPTIPEFFSARVGCKTFQPLFFGVDLSHLCLRD
jgi:DNA-binding SARP family transcriptional activator